jgi:hypothetical protein
MIKKVFLALLLANAALIAYLQWGGALTQESGGGQPALHPEKIKLLGFSPEPAASRVAPASVPVPVVVPPAPAPQPASSPPPAASDAKAAAAACVEWGEFSGADLARAKADLAGLKLGSDLSQREVEHSIGYWVYIPPLKNRAAVNAKVGQLKKRGIQEFFVVSEKGKWQNAISLNVFKTRPLADKFRSKLRAKGIKDAVIGERQTRLKFTVFRVRNPSAATLSKLVGWQHGFTSIEMKAVECK